MGLAQVLGLGRRLDARARASERARAAPARRRRRLLAPARRSHRLRARQPRCSPATRDAPEQLAVRLDPGASASRGGGRAERQGASVSTSTGVSHGGSALVAALKALLRAVAAVDVLVCLYTLVQALTLTGERAPISDRAAARVRRPAGARCARCSRARRWRCWCRRPPSGSCSSASCSARRSRTSRPAMPSCRSARASRRSRSCSAGWRCSRSAPSRGLRPAPLAASRSREGLA